MILASDKQPRESDPDREKKSPPAEKREQGFFVDGRFISDATQPKTEALRRSRSQCRQC